MLIVLLRARPNVSNDGQLNLKSIYVFTASPRGLLDCCLFIPLVCASLRFNQDR